MKKPTIALSIFYTILFVSLPAFAEDSYEPPDDQQDMEQRDGMQDDRGERMRMGGDRQGMMGGKGMGMMKGGMMGGMHQQSVVATSDGGVVIVSGGKIAKYDSELNLVKEIELKKDKASKRPIPEGNGEHAGHHEPADEASSATNAPEAS